MMNKKIITLIGVAALMASIVTMNTQSASASSAYVEGLRDGDAEGNSDAINDRDANARCGSGHSNDYCLGYKLAYTKAYHWTNLVQD